ncbi:MAG: hypothetical protein V4550_13920 [Gemmatimonadota bacterium]
MRRARLARYGLWQLRDYTMDRGLPTILILVLFAYLTLAPALMSVNQNLARMSPAMLEKLGGIDKARANEMQSVAVMVLRSLLATVVYLGALLAMNGIVGTDRKMGFYRFLFAKPVSPMRYYGQAFVVHLAGYVVIVALLSLVFGWLITPIVSATLIAALALMYVLYAGILFAFSASVPRGDWIALVAITMIASYLWERFAESTSFLAKLLYLLPPLHRTAEVYVAVAKGDAVNWKLVAWFAGYGVACFIAGLVVLRRRRLAVA